MEPKIIVQHRGTKAYVSRGQQDHPHWTQHPPLARQFATPYHALYFCVDEELENADIVYRSPDGQEERFLRC